MSSDSSHNTHSSTYSNLSHISSTIKKNQHVVLSIISLIIIVFSMLMILLNALGKTEGGSDSVYFALISNIIGLFTPSPSKFPTQQPAPQITNETQTDPLSSLNSVAPPPPPPPPVIRSVPTLHNHHRRKKKKSLSSSSFDNEYSSSY